MILPIGRESFRIFPGIPGKKRAKRRISPNERHIPHPARGLEAAVLDRGGNLDL